MSEATINMLKLFLNIIHINSVLFLCFLCKTLLVIMGWKLLSETTIETIQSLNRAIMVGPHTSGWDLILLLIYMGTNPELSKMLRVIVKPQLGPYLKYFGNVFISAPRYEDRGGNGVDKISQILTKEEKFLLLISPEGKRDLAPWRTGFLNIAKKIPKCMIGVTSLDYEKKEWIVKPQLFNPETVNIEEIQNYSSDIVPLYPECSFVKVIRTYQKEEVTLIDFVLFSNILCALTVIPLVFFKRSGLNLFLVCSSMCCSCLYHHRKENCSVLQKIDSIFAFTCLFIHVIDVLFYIDFSSGRLLIQFGLWFFTFLSYLNAIRKDHYHRDSQKPRSSDYIYWHTIFHFSGALSYIHSLF